MGSGVTSGSRGKGLLKVGFGMAAAAVMAKNAEFLRTSAIKAVDEAHRLFGQVRAPTVLCMLPSFYAITFEMGQGVGRLGEDSVKMRFCDPCVVCCSNIVLVGVCWC